MPLAALLLRFGSVIAERAQGQAARDRGRLQSPGAECLKRVTTSLPRPPRCAVPLHRGIKPTNVAAVGRTKVQATRQCGCHGLHGICRQAAHAGAPIVGAPLWTMYPQGAVKVTKGTPKIYLSSEHGRRHFCPDCGTGLFYTNAEILPEIIDIQSATYDDPDAVPARAHIQVADRIGWMARAHELPDVRALPATGVIRRDAPPGESPPHRVHEAAAPFVWQPGAWAGHYPSDFDHQVSSRLMRLPLLGAALKAPPWPASCGSP